MVDNVAGDVCCEIVISSSLVEADQFSQVMSEHSAARHSFERVDVRGDQDLIHISIQLGYPLLTALLAQIFGHFLAKRRQQAERRQQPFAGSTCSCRLQAGSHSRTYDRVLLSSDDCEELAKVVSGGLDAPSTQAVRLLIEGDE